MKSAVLVFPGINRERDMARALKLISGHEPAMVWHAETALPDGTDLVVVPGGFSYGDYLRCGAIAARAPIMDAVRAFAGEGGLVLGVCNGFQILCEAGLLPGALIRNRDLAYRCDWVHLRVESERTPFTEGLEGAVLKMPIGNGEGCWVADPDTLARVEDRGQVVFRYVGETGARDAAANPNGSLNDIAGVCNEEGNILGLMPHPERCSEALLGGTDGYRMLVRLASVRHGTAPAVYRHR